MRQYRLGLKIDLPYHCKHVHGVYCTTLPWLLCISDVRINNIRYAMVAQLQNPSPGFEDVVRAHFYLKKDRILQVSS